MLSLCEEIDQSVYLLGGFERCTLRSYQRLTCDEIIGLDIGPMSGHT